MTVGLPLGITSRDSRDRKAIFTNFKWHSVVIAGVARLIVLTRVWMAARSVPRLVGTQGILAQHLVDQLRSGFQSIPSTTWADDDSSGI